jgi:hypothetical protein
MYLENPYSFVWQYQVNLLAQGGKVLEMGVDSTKEYGTRVLSGWRFSLGL